MKIVTIKMAGFFCCRLPRNASHAEIAVAALRVATRERASASYCQRDAVFRQAMQGLSQLAIENVSRHTYYSCDIVQPVPGSLCAWSCY